MATAVANAASGRVVASPCVALPMRRRGATRAPAGRRQHH
jgi:hypothetical protein